MEIFEELKQVIVLRLRSSLPPGMYYHSPEHTLEVLGAAEKIATSEKVVPADVRLIKTAALFHDTGYTISYYNHEENSCKITRQVLPDHNYSPAEIEMVCELIMATKVPQTPKTKTAEILCDADLDYLGRDDFYNISQILFKELKEHNKVKDQMEWNLMQIKFLESHRYFTQTSQTLRAPVKAKYLEEIKAVIEGK